MVRKSETINEPEKDTRLNDPIHGKVPLHWQVNETKGREIGTQIWTSQNQKIWLSQYAPDAGLLANCKYHLVDSHSLTYQEFLNLSNQFNNFLENYHKENGYCIFCFHNLTGLPKDKNREFKKSTHNQTNLSLFRCFIQGNPLPKALIPQTPKLRPSEKVFNPSKNQEKTLCEYSPKMSHFWNLAPCIHQFLTIN